MNDDLKEGMELITRHVMLTKGDYYEIHFKGYASNPAVFEDIIANMETKVSIVRDQTSTWSNAETPPEPPPHPKPKKDPSAYQLEGGNVYITVGVDRKDAFKALVFEVTKSYPRWDTDRIQWKIADSKFTVTLEKALREAGFIGSE